jgi:hypothetical protein
MKTFISSTAVLGAAALGAFLAATPAQAANFSFRGNFTKDDDVQLFNFTVGTSSNVTLRTYSYAGGTQADGTVVPRGGFDPILALFDSAGVRINTNDDGSSSVPADSVSGARYDTFLQSTLGAGSYTVSVMEFDNFSVGPNLSNGFTRTGQGNFTPALVGANCTARAFCDVSGSLTGTVRTNAWAFDVLNVDRATTPTVPTPALLPGLIGLGATAWRKRRNAATAEA